jgi:hypothetical protein
MRKALQAARLSMRLYLRSGQVVLPMLAMLTFLLVFYHVRPFHVVGSYSISFAAAFGIAMWFGISLVWAEEPQIAQILSVKVGMRKLLVAQQVRANVFVAVFSVLLVSVPALESVFIPGFFIRSLTVWDLVSAGCMHVCAAVCGCSLGMMFHPRLLRDRKLAFIACIMLGLLSFVSGGLHIPYIVRFLLPPLYDSLYQTGASDAFTQNYIILYALRFLGYGFVCSAAQVTLLYHKKF